jgi:hypothetical protein
VIEDFTCSLTIGRGAAGDLHQGVGAVRGLRVIRTGEADAHEPVDATAEVVGESAARQHFFRSSEQLAKQPAEVSEQGHLSRGAVG